MRPTGGAAKNRQEGGFLVVELTSRFLNGKLSGQDSCLIKISRIYLELNLGIKP